MPISDSILFPNSVVVEYEGGSHVFAHPNQRMAHKDIVVDLTPNQPDEAARLEVGVTAGKSALLSLRRGARPRRHPAFSGSTRTRKACQAGNKPSTTRQVAVTAHYSE